MRYELACSRRSGQWIVDSGQWREMENGGKQTWKSLEERKRERVGIMVYIQLERRALWRFVIDQQGRIW